MRPVIRRLCLAAGGVLCLAVPSAAEDAGRYALSASRDGFVRLDTVTGSVSHCRPEKGVWRCEPLPAEDSALRARLDALTTEVARLTASVAALNGRVAALAPPAEAPKPAAVAAPPPPEARPGFLRQTMVRFLDFVRVLKHGRGEA